MTIQIPNVGTGVPADQTGDSPWLAMKKVAENFSNTIHAASRLVGTASGNLMEVGAFGWGAAPIRKEAATLKDFIASFDKKSQIGGYQDGANIGISPYSAGIYAHASNTFSYFTAGPYASGVQAVAGDTTTEPTLYTLLTDINTTKDANGFLKRASPVVDLYDNKIGLNHDAKLQPITFEKVSVGSYLVKGSLGFAQEGWYIETPKDANGNVLVAVVYEQLENNDLSVKTYAKRFDDETGDIVANLAKPRDIPTGRFISLRLHELPKESPVMPSDTPTEV